MRLDRSTKFPLTSRSLGGPEGKEEEQADEPDILDFQHGSHVPKSRQRRLPMLLFAHSPAGPILISTSGHAITAPGHLQRVPKRDHDPYQVDNPKAKSDKVRPLPRLLAPDKPTAVAGGGVRRDRSGHERAHEQRERVHGMYTAEPPVRDADAADKGVAQRVLVRGAQALQEERHRERGQAGPRPRPQGPARPTGGGRRGRGAGPD